MSPPRAPANLIFCDRDSLEDAVAAFPDDGRSLAVLSFAHSEIESGTTGAALDRLMVLGDSADEVRKLAGKVVIEVRGYDVDPRELYEIPACRTFFQALAGEWGGWLHFLEKDDCLPTFLTFLIAVEVQRRTGGTVGSRMMDPNQLTAVVARLFEQMNVLYAHHHLGLAARRTMTDAVGASIDHMFVPL